MIRVEEYTALYAARRNILTWVNFTERVPTLLDKVKQDGVHKADVLGDTPGSTGPKWR